MLIMSLVSLSVTCFNAVERSLEAVEAGDAAGASVILQSVAKDGSLLQQKASDLRDQLNVLEGGLQERVENLASQDNQLYKKEKELGKVKQALESKKSSLCKMKEQYITNWRNASIRRQEAEKERREAEEKYDQVKYLWWIPIVGWILIVRELIQENAKKAQDAYREMKQYEREMDRAKSEIEWANLSTAKV